MPRPLDFDALADRLRRFEWLFQETADSTQTVAKERLDRDGLADRPLVVVARRQTAAVAVVIADGSVVTGR